MGRKRVIKVVIFMIVLFAVFVLLTLIAPKAM
jgi:hypothetical protein